MRKTVCLLSSLLWAQLLDAHHGPGIRGYDPEKPVTISGVITKCIECGGGGHGILEIRVGSVMWAVTLPANSLLKKAKVPMNRLKPKHTVTVAGFANKSKANDMFADEIIADGVKVLGRLIPIG